jgi:hypothetical protein
MHTVSSEVFGSRNSRIPLHLLADLVRWKLHAKECDLGPFPCYLPLSNLVTDISPNIFAEVFLDTPFLELIFVLVFPTRCLVTQRIWVRLHVLLVKVVLSLHTS